MRGPAVTQAARTLALLQYINFVYIAMVAYLSLLLTYCMHIGCVHANVEENKIRNSFQHSILADCYIGEQYACTIKVKTVCWNKVL